MHTNSAPILNCGVAQTIRPVMSEQKVSNRSVNWCMNLVQKRYKTHINHAWMRRGGGGVYSRFFVQQSESLFWDFESLRQPPLQSLHGLLKGQGELEACAGGGVDVQIHGGLSRDGLARRSPTTGAAPGAGVLVHPITCGQRRGGGGNKTSRAGEEEGQQDGGGGDPRPLFALSPALSAPPLK